MSNIDKSKKNWTVLEIVIIHGASVAYWSPCMSAMPEAIGSTLNGAHPVSEMANRIG